MWNTKFDPEITAVFIQILEGSASMENNIMKEVTAAIIINKGRVLIAQRDDKQKLAGKWEFPGGKIEPGETAEECLKREIKEELGIKIEVDKFFAESIYHYVTGTIKLIAYEARWVEGEYKLAAHSQIKWVKPDELGNYDFSPADLPFIEKLKQDMK